MTPKRRRRSAALCLTSLLIVGCAGNQVLRQADLEMQRGNLDTAIAYYQRQLLEDPGDTEAKIKLQHAKVRSSQEHERAGGEYMEAGDWRNAVAELQLAIALDPGNEMAVRKFGEAQAGLLQQQQIEAGELTATELARQAALEQQPAVPMLDPQVTAPLSFDFRDVAVTEVYRTLAQIAGLNVMFEPTLRDDPTTFQVENTRFQDALGLLSATNGHFTKVLSPTTFMVVPDNQTKRREYADQVMRTFYLSNADAATVEQQIRAILTIQQVSSNPDLNTVTVRDSPAAIEVIERLVRASDKAVGEILLEVEILEVGREVVANYGLALEPFGGQVSINQAAGEGGNAGLSLSQLGNLTSADIFVTVPSLFYQFLRTTNDFKLVAQPKLRAREGETTELHVGQRVPVVTTTFNPQTTVGGNIVPVSGTNYEETGILLKVLPRVHFNGEITLEIEIKVTAVTATATIANVGDLPVFTERSVIGQIRLKDGETNVIAGLLRENNTRTRRGIIGVDNVPGLGDALSDTNDFTEQNDIVISITPHLLRAADITAEDMKSVYVGTQQTVGARVPFSVGRGAAAGGVPPVGGAAPVGGDQLPESEAEAPPASMALMPQDHVVGVGEEFGIDITLETAAEVFSAGMELEYDPGVLQYVDHFEGGFLERDGAEITVFATGDSPGLVRVGMTRVDSEVGVAGGGSLLTLVFRAIGEGEATIRITSAALRAPLGAPLPVQLMSPASVNVGRRD